MCDFKGTYTGVTELTTPPSNVIFQVWCENGKLYSGCHEADSFLLGNCIICYKEMGKLNGF